MPLTKMSYQNLSTSYKMVLPILIKETIQSQPMENNESIFVIHDFSTGDNIILEDEENDQDSPIKPTNIIKHIGIQDNANSDEASV